MLGARAEPCWEQSSTSCCAPQGFRDEIFRFSCRKDSSVFPGAWYCVMAFISQGRENFSILGCYHLQHFENQWTHWLPGICYHGLQALISRKKSSCSKVKAVVNTQHIAAHCLRSATESKPAPSISSTPSCHLHPKEWPSFTGELSLKLLRLQLLTQCWWIWLASTTLLWHLQVCFHFSSRAMNN